MIKDETGARGQGPTDAAFSLVEAMIASAIMILALGLLLTVFISSKRSAAISQNYLAALQVASKEAERLRTNAYADIGPADTTLTNSGVEFQIGRIITTNITDSYKNITFTIEWTGPILPTRRVLTNYMILFNTN